MIVIFYSKNNQLISKRLGDAVPPLKKNRSSISSLCFDPTSIFFPFVRQ